MTRTKQTAQLIRPLGEKKLATQAARNRATPDAAKRHRSKKQKHFIENIKNSDMIRIFRLAGVPYSSAEAKKEAAALYGAFLTRLLHRTKLIAEHSQRKTLTVKHLNQALSLYNRQVLSAL